MESILNYEKLEKNITDMLIEQQIKLGYRDELVRLYYPKASVCALLDIDGFIGDNQLLEALDNFSAFEKDRAGEIDCKIIKDGRICVKISKEAGKAIHSHIGEYEFLKKLIDGISAHLSIEEVLDIFKKQDENVIVKHLTDNDFEYLVYFKSGIPDDFYYCFNVEGNHVIYHRFLKSDYEEMFG